MTRPQFPWSQDRINSSQPESLSQSSRRPELDTSRPYSVFVLGKIIARPAESHCFVYLCLTDCLHCTERRGKFLISSTTDLLPNTGERVESFCNEEENLNKKQDSAEVTRKSTNDVKIFKC